jgi:hypothetical protein
MGLHQEKKTPGCEETDVINADDALKVVFGGKKQVSMFEMTKLAWTIRLRGVNPPSRNSSTVSSMRSSADAPAEPRGAAVATRQVKSVWTQRGEAVCRPSSLAERREGWCFR